MSDEEETEQVQVFEHPLYPGGLPTWRFSPWDMAYVAVATIGGLFNTIGQGLGMLGREFNAAANFARAQKELEENYQQWLREQRDTAQALERYLESESLSQSEGEQ